VTDENTKKLFEGHLREVFGDRMAEFSVTLQEKLFALWTKGRHSSVLMGIDVGGGTSITVLQKGVILQQTLMASQMLMGETLSESRPEERRSFVPNTSPATMGVCKKSRSDGKTCHLQEGHGGKCWPYVSSSRCDCCAGTGYDHDYQGRLLDAPCRVCGGPRPLDL
jgi:hypothetical protein